MQTLPQVPNKLAILTTTADRAANSGCKLTGRRFVETLVFSWLANPDATYTVTAQTAGALGTPILGKRLNSVSPPKLQRL